jgi:hypothetical protein
LQIKAEAIFYAEVRKVVKKYCFCETHLGIKLSGFRKIFGTYKWSDRFDGGHVVVVLNLCVGAVSKLKNILGFDYIF